MMPLPRSAHYPRLVLTALGKVLAICLLFACAGAQASADAAAPQGGPDPIVFESRPNGGGGGGLIISANPGAHTFRLLQRTQISEVGARLSSFEPVSVYAAIHRVDTPNSVPDVAGDSRLVATTLIDIPGDSVATDRSAPLSVTLEPGWYAITVGTGRYGATATGFQATLVQSGTTLTPTSFGPYSVNASTNARTLLGASLRFFLRGQTLTDEPLPANRFLFETARPTAWWSQSSSGISGSGFRAQRFEVSDRVQLGKVSSWLQMGSGQLFAAVVQIAGPGANPPNPGSAAFNNALRATTLITSGSAPAEYSGDFGGVELSAGHYALILGSGAYGAGGTANIMGVVDQLVVPGVLWWTGNFWAPVGDSVRIALEGVIPELEVTPDPVAFERTGLLRESSQQVTVHNRRDGDLTLGSISLSGDAADQFALGDDVDACQNVILPAMGSCVVTVVFAPDNLGQHDATLDIASDGLPDPYSVSLSGEGVNVHIVSPSAGSNGSITPDSPQEVLEGDTTSFELVADLGYQIDAISSDCGGSLLGSTYTTAPISVDCQLDVSFALTPATSISIISGDEQSAVVDQAFAEALLVQVTNAQGLPVPGVSVQITVPDQGASALAPISIPSDESGQASISLSANTVAGSYSISLDFAGADSPVQANLSNLPGAAHTLAILGGDAQDTLVGTAFKLPMSVRLSDSFDNPIANTIIEFSVPATGASAILSTSAVESDDQGQAAVTATANALAGSYQVMASPQGSAVQASFTLTNNAPEIALTASIDSGQSHAAYGSSIAYLITISNAGPDTANAISVASTLSAALDLSSSQWTCMDPASGCAPAGSGELLDSGISLSAGESVNYVLSANLLDSTEETQATSSIDAISPDSDDVADDSDSVALVIFRTGFEAQQPLNEDDVSNQ